MHMDVLGKARRLEWRIAGTVEQAAKGLVRPAPREPLEIVHVILDALEREIQPSGRGTRVFPFNRVDVSVVAPSREARGRLEAVFSGAMPLHARIVERLQASGCPAPDLQLAIHYVERAGERWRTPEVDIEFARVDPSEVDTDRRESKPPRIEVAVLRGTAERRNYSFVAARIDLGRCAEVRDGRHRLIRTNHIAFADGSDDADLTVSRQHAHITCDSRTGHVRLHDDGSGHGTGIVRDGRTVPVPRGSRGVRLRSGDEIVLGDARLRIRFSEPRGSLPESPRPL
jgi:FHA domain-containing protein